MDHNREKMDDFSLPQNRPQWGPTFAATRLLFLYYVIFAIGVKGAAVLNKRI